MGALPPPGWERPDVCSITLIGLGSLLGLEIMTRTPAAPRVLFVESSFGFRDAPPAMVSDATDPLLRTIHAWFPLTTATANWINMIGKSQYDVSPYLWRPTESWAEWREKRMAYSDIYVSIYGQEVNDWGKHHLDDNLAAPRPWSPKWNAAARESSSFDTPLDPRVGELPVIALWTGKMHAAFPDHEWVTDSPEKYWLTDGMHFVSGSGEDFFKLLMSHLGWNEREIRLVSRSVRDRRSSDPLRAALRLRDRRQRAAGRAADDEQHDTGKGDQAGMQQPEARGRHLLQQPAEPADEVIPEKEVRVINAQHQGNEVLRRGAREQRQTDREDVGETDIVEELERDGPAETGFLPRGRAQG
ncbi:MAG: hypothetical protein WDN69_21050 [Aliidongia sp.]